MLDGIYGHPGPLREQDLRLGDLGVNTIFPHSGSINQTIIDRVRAEGT